MADPRGPVHVHVSHHEAAEPEGGALGGHFLRKSADVRPANVLCGGRPAAGARPPAIARLSDDVHRQLTLHQATAEDSQEGCKVS